MGNKFLSVLVVVFFLCVCPALGVVEFKDGLVHDIDYRIDDNIRVDYGAPAMYTTVNWLDGGMNYWLSGYGNSRINVLGGSIDKLYSYSVSRVDMSGGRITGCLSSGDSSEVDISGGTIKRLYVNDSSRVNVSGGSIRQLFMSYDLSQVNIFGGLTNGFSSYDSSQVNITGGSISGILRSFDFSQVDISGGSIRDVHSGGSSHVDISGGLIDGNLCSNSLSQVCISGGSVDGDLCLLRSSMLAIYGLSFAVDGQLIGYGELTSIFGGDYRDEPLRHLTGTLLSGELIDNDFYIGHDARIVLIPEPATILLLGLGSLMLRRKKR